MYQDQLHQLHQLFEGLEQGDLARLVHPKLHIDEFKSKMGDDTDVAVLSFLVQDQDPANDLMSFIERGYDWVIDADVSEGDIGDDQYLVFVEAERRPQLAKNIVKLMEDIMRITEQDLSDWRFQYQKSHDEYEITEQELRRHVPLTPHDYEARFGGDKDIEAMQESARVPMKNKRAPKNEWTESLRVAAGLK